MNTERNMGRVVRGGLRRGGGRGGTFLDIIILIGRYGIQQIFPSFSKRFSKWIFMYACIITVNCIVIWTRKYILSLFTTPAPQFSLFFKSDCAPGMSLGWDIADHPNWATWSINKQRWQRNRGLFWVLVKGTGKSGVFEFRDTWIDYYKNFQDKHGANQT